MADCQSCGASLPDDANFCPKCGSVQERVDEGDELIGQTLGTFRIVAVLGEGAMGRVYRAVQTTLGREVCVKTLHPHLAAEQSLIQRFQREARSASALNHPNIVNVLDFGRTPQGLLYIVMEFIDGRDLREVLEDDSPLPVERVLRITGQILSALEEAHASGVIHRDLKPENVLVQRLRDGADLVKIVDFGIAKIAETSNDDPRLTATGMAIGTPGYMAPEQIMGEQVDLRADIYSMGVILYEMLALRPPFLGDTLRDLVQQHLSQTREPPSTFAKVPLPAGLDEIVLRSIARRRDARFETALDFKRSVEALRTSMRTPGASATPAAVAAPAAPATAEMKRQSPLMETLQQLMPENLAGHIADLPSMLAGEKRIVTVLHAEVSGFRALDGVLDARDVHDLRDRTFDAMAERVQRYEGIVDKSVGDRMMALFGVPKAHEDDPERAVRCALEVREFIHQVNQKLPSPLGLRVGINAGEALLAGVGGQRTEGTVTGEVVDVAEWLLSGARVGSILVGQPIHSSTADRFDFDTCSPLTLRGRSEPLDSWEVLRRVEQESIETQLIGRERAFELLGKLFAGAAAGKAAGMLVIGQPGMGKSALMEEARKVAEEGGLLVISGGAGRFGSESHLQLIRELVFSLCGGVPADAARAERRLGALATHGLDVHEVRRLRQLFGERAADGDLDEEERRLLARAAVRKLFLGDGSRAGTCLLVDDLHLADSGSLDILRDVLDAAHGRGLVFIATARTADSEQLLPRLQRYNLDPLADDEIAELLRQALGGIRTAGRIPEKLAAHAEGNPLFAREIVRALIDKGDLQLAKGAWTLRATAGELAVPDSLRLLIRSRFDRLSGNGKAFLRYAAVAGRSFGLDLVAAAAADVEVDAATALDEGRKAGFLVPWEGVPGGVRFAQAVAHETVLASLTETLLKHIHLRLAEALESGLGSVGENPAEALAHHLLEAGQIREGVRYLTMAGDWLARRHAYAEAGVHHRRALQLCLDMAPRKEGTIADAGATEDILRIAAKAGSCLSMISPEQSAELLEQVLDQTGVQLTSTARAEVLRQRGQALLKLSRVREAGESFTQALNLVVGGEDVEFYAGLKADVAAALEASGDYPMAAHQLLEGLQSLWAAEPEDPDLMWRILNQLGRIHLRAGETQKAKEFFENARQAAEKAPGRVGEARILTNLASLQAMLNDDARAEKLFREALDLSERAGDPIGVSRIHYNLGRLYAKQRRNDEAVELLTKARDIAREVGWREGIASASQALDMYKRQG